MPCLRVLPVVLHLAASEERPIAYQRSKSGISSEGATATVQSGNMMTKPTLLLVGEVAAAVAAWPFQQLKCHHQHL